MKTYLTLKSIPELSDLPMGVRRRFWRKYSYKAFQHRQTWIGFFVYLVIASIGFLLSLLIHPWVPFGYIITGIGFAFGLWVFFQFMIPVVRKYLKKDSEIKRLLGN